MNHFPQSRNRKRFAAELFRALFTCFAILISIILQCHSAAADTWSYRYYTPDNAPVEFNDVIPVSSGGHLAVGKCWDPGTSDTAYNALISRFDQNGQILWSRNFTFPGRWEDDLRSVVESSDGGFIATGRILLDGTTEHGSPVLVSAVLILKVDANGNLLWDRLIQNYANNSTYGARIKATIDGHFVIVGEAPAYQWNEQYEVYTYVANGALIVKIDTNGNVIFSNTHYGDWTHSWNWSFNDVVQDNDGAYYAIGYASVEGYSEGVGWGGMLLAKIDNAGSMVWAKKIDYASGGEAVNVRDNGRRILFSDGTLYVAGATYTLNLSSFSLSGVRNWTKQFYQGNGAVGISYVNDFIPGNDGNFFIATGNTSIIKINPLGVVLWSNLTTPHFPYSLSLTADNGLIVGGWSDKSGTARGGIVAKYDSNGESCHDNSDIPFTVNDIEMVTNSVVYNAWSRPAVSGTIPSFSGPAMTVEKVCEDTGDAEDNDGDGYSTAQGDCNDNDNTIYPGAIEICGDGIDQDCDGSDLACAPDPDDTDNDGDGYTENQGDCNDNNNKIHPGAIEICGDGIDQDCDGAVDEDCGAVWAGDYTVQIQSTLTVKKVGKFSESNGGQLSLEENGSFELDDYSTIHDVMGAYTLDAKGISILFTPSAAGLGALEDSLIEWLEANGLYDLNFNFQKIKTSKVKIDKNTGRATGKIKLDVSGTVSGCVSGEGCGTTKFKYKAMILLAD